MRPETQTEWEERMSKEIIEYLCGEIYTDLRFLDIALNALEPKGKEQVNVFATNGTFAYNNPLRVIDLFKKNEKYLIRAYLHMVFHCLYCHLWQRGNRVKQLWDIACDIAVERVIDNIDKPCTKRILGFLRQEFYKKMDELGIVSAAQIYQELLSEIADGNEEYINELAREFYTDDHFFWPEEEKQNPNIIGDDSARKEWEKKARQIMQKKSKGDNGDYSENVSIADIKIYRKKRSYRAFLKKFAIFTENLRCDEDEFDKNFYMFGLEKYGNLPLIEPIETKEDRFVRDFVIVIDTSYSTKGELVKKFISETFSILNEENIFQNNNRIHIIQCDEAVQNDRVIEGADELTKYLDEFQLMGGGNTDFRPAFEYVNELILSGDLRNLDGLIYFTDGKGKYPKQAPGYKTAFVFLEDYDEIQVPVWAMKGEFFNEYS